MFHFMMPHRAWPGSLRWALLLGLFCLVVLGAATLGAPVPVSDLWSSDLEHAAIARRIFWRADGEWGLRPVRITAAALIGASLASSGAALQTIFRNPLAEPYLLGISSGGALGATVGLELQSRASGLQPPTGIEGLFDLSTVLAFGGALGATALVYALGRRRLSPAGGSDGGFEHGGFDRTSLLLAGVALSAFLSALMALVVALGNRTDLAQQVMFWLLGGLTRATPTHNVLLAITLAIGLCALALSARDLNALQMSDEEALGLGVALGALHRRLLLATALMSAAAVAAAGLIGFVGLLAPHLIRLMFGSDARTLGPAAALGGATLLVGCDAIARSIARPVEIPVGIVTALLGVPLFLFLLRRA